MAKEEAAELKLRVTHVSQAQVDELEARLAKVEKQVRLNTPLIFAGYLLAFIAGLWLLVTLLG